MRAASGLPDWWKDSARRKRAMRDVFAGGRRVLHRQAFGARAGGAGPGRIVFGEIGLEILDGLGGVAGLLDGAGLAENDVIAELARQFHGERLGVERVGFGEIRLRRVGDVGIGLGFEFLGEAEDFADQRLLAFRGEDAGGFGAIDGGGLGEFLLFDQRLRLEKHRLVTPVGFREIREQLVGGGDGLGKFLALKQGRGLEEERLIGGGILGGDELDRRARRPCRIGGHAFPPGFVKAGEGSATAGCPRDQDRKRQVPEF